MARYDRRMPYSLRPIEKNELKTASELCLRSKAHWGYDQQFIEACRKELTITQTDLANDLMIVAEEQNQMIGIAHVTVDDIGCYLDKLFVEPGYMGGGVGRALYEWALDTARNLKARKLIIEADPDAAPFYEKMGAGLDGQIESSSISDRFLPRFVHHL